MIIIVLHLPILLNLAWSWFLYWIFVFYLFISILCLQKIVLGFAYQVIEKPMDFSTIEKKMEAKDVAGYKNVREIYADVRLVFKNAMKYNDEKDDVHVMAKTLLEKFEEKWLQLLPKVAEEVNSCPTMSTFTWDIISLLTALFSMASGLSIF